MSERYWEIWDEDRSRFYADTYGEPDKPVESQLVRLMIGKSLLEGNSVLDVGCGIGHFYHVLPKNMKYLGMDSSPHMIKYAREHADAEFVVGDIYNMEGLPICDSVISQSVLIHLPEIETPIKEMWKHAGKALIFSIPTGVKPVMNNRKKYKDKFLISHSETMDNIKNIVETLPEYLKMSYVVEPKWKLNNTYFKVWRK